MSLLHQLLSSAEPDTVNQQRWALFQGRLADLVNERMNPRRTSVQQLVDPLLEHSVLHGLIQTLALGAGDGGFDRLKASLMDAANPGGLGGTYGGNPIGIAAAHAVLDVIEEEKLCARANELGSRLKQKLESIKFITIGLKK
jgi:hypothetical protein